MFKLMHKKLNKKGFTLAEMLIVVAIIAILVAIAVPIFVKSLEKAEQAAKDANVRGVKAVAIAEILDGWETNPFYYGHVGKSATGATPDYWVVTATVNAAGNGDINITAITAQDGTPGNTKYTYVTDPSGKIDIGNVVITDVTVPKS